MDQDTLDSALISLIAREEPVDQARALDLARALCRRVIELDQRVRQLEEAARAVKAEVIDQAADALTNQNRALGEAMESWRGHG